jgi:N-acetylmuramoyl-L-alanine amidase
MIANQFRRGLRQVVLIMLLMVSVPAIAPVGIAMCKVSWNYVTHQTSLKELDCLATNLYHEARGEGTIGMEAVARVTLNRLATPGFPDTICKVVYQPKQFSWTNSVAVIKDTAAYKQAVSVAEFVLSTPQHDFTNGSLFFHTIQIKRPTWTKSLEESLVINNHVFYKERK